jgi:Ni/Fe-hydrogenase subunit HybB-like protein
MSARAAAVGGPIMTRPFRILLGIFIIGMLTVAWRFWVGLGPASALSDGYPWGLWIALDVVTGTALACGGYAVALLVYVFNRGQYHPLVRPAVLTSALGYSLAGLAIAIDVGRPWLIWRVPIAVGKYNLNSALLEVALCVMAYVVVLWIELSPAFLEKFAKRRETALGSFSAKVGPAIEKSLPFILALGLLLPTMHQSSLGTVMLLAGWKLHVLWNTPLVPALFLISCLSMGYAMVVLEASLATTVFGRKRETRILATMAPVIASTLVIFMVLRVVDVVVRGQVGALFAFDSFTFWFLLEFVLFAVPAVMLFKRDRLGESAYLFRVALLIVLAGTFYRFATYLIAYNPGPQWSYFPAVPEMIISAGVIAGEVLLYLIIVKRFPILAGETTAYAGS